eukprot:Amastigsp_a342549_20.p2 type:complete len:207 gc:universal Amastigsp_a342549_20:741-121(-)
MSSSSFDSVSSVCAAAYFAATLKTSRTRTASGVPSSTPFFTVSSSACAMQTSAHARAIGSMTSGGRLDGNVAQWLRKRSALRSKSPAASRSSLHATFAELLNSSADVAVAMVSAACEHLAPASADRIDEMSKSRCDISNFFSGLRYRIELHSYLSTSLKRMLGCASIVATRLNAKGKYRSSAAIRSEHGAPGVESTPTMASRLSFM